MIKYAEKEDLWGYAKRLRFVREAIRDVFGDREAANVRVLDVGCGNGSYLALPLARQGFPVTGIDTDKHSIEHARSLARDLHSAKFMVGEVEEQLSASDLFDVVILSEVLEHLEKPRALLAASVSHMAAAGILIVTVPNGYGEFEMDSWLFRTLRLQSLVDRLAEKKEVASATDNQESGHVQFFTRRQLRGLFAACDLKVINEGVGSLLSGPLAGHLLGRSQRFIEWNARTADKLPAVLSSSWYFVLRRTSRQQSFGAEA